MPNICEPKRKSRNLFVENFPAVKLLRFGLLICTVFVATINVNQVDAVECGTVNLYREAVLGGKEVLKDEWPFIAALYYSRTFKYFCGGTIISNKHVLTAAHCVQSKGTGVLHSPDNIIVRLGAFNLTDRSEMDSVDINVTKIYVHPDWNYNVDKYDADIAILVLNENLTFSRHIRPVCMPPANFLIDGLVGTVVGWGKTENGTAEGVPRKIEVNALNDTYCYETDKGIARFASERSFCGEGSGTPNYGDSGGGFFAVAGSGWVQFGTVSFIRPKAIGNIRKVALYMKLTSLRDWIADKVEQSGGNISLATTKIDQLCTYEYTNDVYGCWLDDLNIRQENFVVENFTGSHDLDKDNEDVELIAFKTGVMVSLPRNVGNIFRNLRSLSIYVNTTRISRSNFQNLERLEQILFSNSSISRLDENSLWDLPNLQSFVLENGALKLLHAATFSRNHKLTTVNILSNALTSLPRNLFQNNSLLEYVSFADNSIDTIDETIFETNAKLRLLSLKGNRLRHLSENLFKNNSELQIVDLSNNRIQTIDELSFTANSRLLSLNLASNDLGFLPEQLLQGMEFLEEVHFDINALKAIDERFFGTNARITEIFLDSNQLTQIPANLFRNNSQLQYIYLGRNSIGEIDENLFEKNVLLQKVSLDFNLLVALPGNLFRHNSMLEFVSVRRNLFETIDERTFHWNARLKEVIFTDNAVSILPGKLFQNNSLLETVHFENNFLESIDKNTFSANANLQAVYLATNLLDHLPENLFRNNSLLQDVDLSTNFFRTLNEDIFSSNPNLQKISLQEGALESLPRNIFRSNSRLQYIDLSDGSLKILETDFTGLKLANYINLSGDNCIDLIFYNDMSYEFRNGTIFSPSRPSTRWTKNLTEFQNLVTANCS